jgi:hypothetical protein
MMSPAVHLLSSAATCGALHLVAHKWPKVGKWLGWGTAGIKGGVAVVNVVTLTR